MKKYIAPSVKVADIENEVILAGSLEMSNEDTDTMDARERGLFDWNNDEE